MPSYIIPAIRAFLSRKRVEIVNIPTGKILDIGGGGEGIIAQIGGERVTVVDKLESEIEEARMKAPAATWEVADASNLTYEDNSIENATAFFSLMYMRKTGVKEDVFKEIYRVLHSKGEFWIWDAVIPESKNVFVIFLKIELPTGKSTMTAYGSQGEEKQSPETISELLQKTGFVVAETSIEKAWFLIKAKKS